MHSGGQRLGQAELVIRFALQKHACIRGQPIVAAADLDGPVERGLEHPFLSLTHAVTPFIVHDSLKMLDFYGQNQKVKRLRGLVWCCVSSCLSANVPRWLTGGFVTLDGLVRRHGAMPGAQKKRATWSPVPGSS